MSQMTDHIKKSTIEAEGIEVFSMWTSQFGDTLTLNVPPSDREEAADVLRENGYTVGSFEELIDVVDDDRFTRIKSIKE